MRHLTAHKKLTKKLWHRLVPMIIICFASGAIYISTTFKKMPEILKRGIQPSDFPQLVCALIIGLCIVMILRDPIKLSERISSMTWATMGILIVFAALVQLDFFIALSAAAVGLAVLWGERKTIRLAVVGFVVPASVFFVFDLVFRIRFPRGVLTSLWYG